MPEYPTVAESGVPGYDVRAWFGMFAPARLPADILAKLNAEAKRAMQAPEVVKRMNLEGAEVALNMREQMIAMQRQFNEILHLLGRRLKKVDSSSQP